MKILKNRPYLQLHIAILLLGFSPVFGKLISLNVGLLTFYRVVCSAIILYAIIKYLKIGIIIPKSEKWAIGRVGVLLTLSWLFFFAGIKYSNISVGVVCFCVTSFFTAILEPLIKNQPIQSSEIGLSALTLVGIALIFHFDTTYRLGIMIGLISPIFYTLYSIYNSQYVLKHEVLVINYYQMLGGSICLTFLLPIYIYFFPSQALFPNWEDAICLLFLSLFCTVCVYLLLSEALKKVSAFTANLSMNLEPIYAIIVAFIFFDENKEVNFSFYLGIALVTISIMLQASTKKKHVT